MPYIYKVSNKINGKAYIGQTTKTVQARWGEHCSDFKKPRNSERPLYVAMRKYGIGNFAVDTVEECNSEALDEREIYWIDYYDTYRNGYNATFGGDGKPTIDYASVFEVYNHLGENCAATAKRLEICEDTVSKIVRALGGRTRRDHNCRRINMFMANGDFVMTFPSTREASRFLIKQNSLDTKNERGYASHISAVCSGKRKMCQGYIWQYA